MRIGCHLGDYSQALFEALIAQDKHPRVYLDGNLHKYAIIADSDRGEVISHKYPFEVDPETGEAVTVTQHGKVEIRFVNGKGEPVAL